MKKIMFNDKFGLTEAVLEGRKTMTRRAVPKKLIRAIEGGAPGFAVMESKYKVGEVVAVAQPYRDIFTRIPSHVYVKGVFTEPKNTSGWANKMFVEAQSMLYFIRITNVRVERMQDISEEDCVREGVQAVRIPKGCVYVAGGATIHDDVRKRFVSGEIEMSEKCSFDTPRDAFAALIDKVSGKGTWESNPWVFVYEFELVK